MGALDNVRGMRLSFSRPTFASLPSLIFLHLAKTLSRLLSAPNPSPSPYCSPSRFPFPPHSRPSSPYSHPSQSHSPSHSRP